MRPGSSTLLLSAGLVAGLTTVVVTGLVAGLSTITGTSGLTTVTGVEGFWPSAFWIGAVGMARFTGGAHMSTPQRTDGMIFGMFFSSVDRASPGMERGRGRAVAGPVDAPGSLTLAAKSSR